MKKNIVLFCLLFIGMQSRCDLVGQMVHYAQQQDEFPESDTHDWKQPTFTTIYQQQQRSLLSRLWAMAALSAPLFSLASFKTLLQDLYRARETMGFKRDAVQKIVVNSSQEQRFIIFGDIQGAFHSLLRDLQQLVRLKCISEDLIVAEDCYIIFNGNLINGSAYNMETLFVVLEIMKRNPDKVIYIKGLNEASEQLADSQLAHQLQSLGYVTTIHDIGAFLNTLPLELYILNEKAEGICIYAHEDTSFTAQPAATNMVAIIKAQTQYPTIGLKRYIGPPTTWSLFSSPTGKHRRLHGFLNDTFAIVTTAAYIENWTITLYYADAFKKQMFASSTYNISMGNLLKSKPLSFYDAKALENLRIDVGMLEAEVSRLKEQCFQKGQKKDELASLETIEKKEIVADARPLLAVRDDTILFGCTFDLLKGLRNQSISLQAGILTKINDINESGGVDGKQLQIVFLDDEYTPNIARANVEKFLNEFKTDLLLSPIGSPTLESYLDLIKEEKVLVFFPITGGFDFRAADLKNIINFRPSYPHELQALTEYLVTTQNARKFLIFYQQDSLGQDPKEAVKATLKRLNITNVAEVPYERNELNFTDKAKQIKEFDPDTIVFISTAVPAENLIRQMGANFFVGKKIFGTSNNFGEASFKNFMRLKGLHFYVPNVVPNPEVSDIDIAQEFRVNGAKNNIVRDTVSFEGYIMTALTAYILEHIEGNITAEKIINFVENIKDLDFKGLRLNFDPQLRTLSQDLWISEGFNEQWTQVRLKPLDIWSSQDSEVVVQQAQVQPESEKQVPVSLPVEQKPEVLIENTQNRAEILSQPLLSLHDTMLVLGSTMDLSKGIKNIARSYIDGMQLRINEINARGGINGITMQLSVLDDAFDPTKARKNVLQFVNQDKIDLIIAPLGLVTLEAYLDFIKEGKVVVLFPSLGGAVTHTTAYTNIITYRPGPHTIMPIMADYILNNHGMKKVALFYQNDDFGKTPLGVLEDFFKQQNITNLLRLPYNRNDLDFSNQVQKMVDFAPDTIAFLATPTATKAFIGQIGASFLHGKTLFGITWHIDEDLGAYLKEKGLRLFAPSLVPNPKNSDIALVKEFVQAAQKTDVPLVANALEGYLYIALLEYVLQKMEQPFTREKIIQAFETIKHLNFKGIDLNFNRAYRELAQDVWIATGINDPWIKVKIEQ